MATENRFKFDAQGVDVILPAQTRQVKLVQLPVGTLQNMKSKAGGFQPGRLVVNLAGEDANHPGEYVEEFDPPIELRIRYTKADVDFAQKSGQPLILAFWNGTEWVPFTAEKHRFQLHPDPSAATGGYGVVFIKRWGDPPIAWGK